MKSIKTCLWLICSTISAFGVDQAAIDQLDYRGIDLGPLGVWGRTQYGTDHILVGSVTEGFAGAESGLEKNDVILAAKVAETDSDFRDFTPELTGDVNGGAGPREELGEAIDDALATASREIILKVHRPEFYEFYSDGDSRKVNPSGGQVLELSVILPDMPSLKESWPFNDNEAATENIAQVTEELCDYIAEKVALGYHRGGNNSITWAGWGMCALISSGNPKYHNAIRTIADELISLYSDENYANWNVPTSNWHISYIGNSLCEYYAATGDQRALPAIKNVMRVICRTTPVEGVERGRHGHGYRQNHGYAYFHPTSNWNAGLNAVTTTLYSAMTFAHYHLGINLDDSATETARYTDEYYDANHWSYDPEITIGSLRHHMGRSLGWSSINVDGTTIGSWHVGYYDGGSEWDAGMRGPQHAAGLIFENDEWLNKDYSQYPDMDNDGNLDASNRRDSAYNNLMERRAMSIRFSKIKPGMAFACHAQTYPGPYWAAQVLRWAKTNEGNAALVEPDITAEERANPAVYEAKRIDNGYESFMRYHRWWFTLSRAPKGYKEKFDKKMFFIGGKGNTGGDGYLGLNNNAHTVPTGMLAAYTGKLQIHGNAERNWFKCGDTENYVSIDLYEKNDQRVPLAAEIVVSGADATLTYNAPAGKKIVSVTATNGKTYSLPAAPATSITITEPALTASFDVTIELRDLNEPLSTWSCAFETADGFSSSNQTLYGGEQLTDTAGGKWSPVTLADHDGTGKAIFKMFWSIGGTTTADLTNNARYPDQFSNVRIPESLGYSSIGDSYGSEIVGYLTAPETGSYTFYINSDDYSKVLLSTDTTEANAVEVAAVNGWRSSWLEGSTVTLTAGEKYFLRGLHKEGGGGDHFYIGWKKPGTTAIETIPATHFESIVPFNGGIAATQMDNYINGTQGLKVPTGATMALELPAVSVGNLSFVAKSGDANNYAFGLTVYIGDRVNTPVIDRSTLTQLYASNVQWDDNVLLPLNLTPAEAVTKRLYFEVTNISGSSSAGLHFDNFKTQEEAAGIAVVSIDLAGNGSVALGETVQYIPIGQDAVEPTISVNNGYTFTGWDRPFTNITGNTVITAQYQQATYTVNFDAGNHGVITAGESTQTVNGGESATAPTVTADYGWLFTGWSGSTTNVTADRTLIANYTADEFLVTVKDQFGTVFYTETVANGQDFSWTYYSEMDGLEIQSVTVNGSAQNVPADQAFGPYPINLTNLTTNQQVVITLTNTRRDDIATNTLVDCGFETSENFPTSTTAPAMDETILDDEGNTWTFNGTSEIELSTWLSGNSNLRIPVDGYVLLNPASYTGGISDITYNFRAGSSNNTYVAVWEIGTTADGWVEIGSQDVSRNNYMDTRTLPVNLTESQLNGKQIRLSVKHLSGSATRGVHFDNLVIYKIDSTPTGTYSVVFDAGELGAITAGEAFQTVNAGSGATAPTVTANDSGKPFSSWDKDFSNVTHDMVVTAQYANSTHTVTFVLGVNGELVNSGDALVQTVYDGHNAVAPAVTGILETDADGRIIGGYEFAGWNQDLNTISSDLTVNAIYRKAPIAVVVNVTGAGNFIKDGRVMDRADKTYFSDSDRDFTFTVKPASGYQIENITTTTGLTIVPANPTVAYTTTITAQPAMDLTVNFVAIDKTADHVVVFDLGEFGTRSAGGELVQHLNHGTAATAPTVTPQSGYTFTGWNADFSNIQSDLRVEAVYSQHTHRVDFVIAAADAGKAVFYDRSEQTQLVVNGQSAKAPDLTLTDANFQFSHWDTDFTNITADTTVTAIFADGATDLGPQFVTLPHTYPVDSNSSWSGTVVIDDATTVTLTTSVNWLTVNRVSGNTFTISGTTPQDVGDQIYEIYLIATDTTGKTSRMPIYLEVIDINEAPVAAGESLDVYEGQMATIDVLANDTDPEGATLSIVEVTTPANGTATINGNQLNYTANNGYIGTDSFTYTISDGLKTAQATVTVNVRGLKSHWSLSEGTGTSTTDEVNAGTATISGATWVQGVQGQALSFDGTDDRVTTWSSSMGGQIDFTVALWVKTTATSNGVLVQQRDGGGSGWNGQYQVRMNADGTVSFYIYRDGYQFSITTTATINDGQWHHVAAVRDGVTGLLYIDGTEAASQAGSTVKSLNSGISVGFGVDIRDNINHFSGVMDEIRIYEKALTAQEMTDLATLPNSAPVAANDATTVNEDGTVNIAVLSNDTDANGDSLTIQSVSTPGNGTAVINGNTVDYTPNANYNGADSFTYTITDGTETATATVNVTVTTVNDAPIAAVDSATTDEDTAVTISVLTNDSDVDNDTLTVQSVTTPTNGTAVITGNEVIYTPTANYNGADAFTYTVTDGTDTATATVNVTVTAVNDAPTLVADNATVAENGSVVINPLTNDSDIDGDTLILQSVSDPSNGTAVITADSVTYTPVANYSGADSFTYTVSDGTVTATANISITVTATNATPVATNDSAITASLTLVSIPALTNDSDSDGDNLTIQSVTTPANGTALINGQNIDYTPTAGFVGTDTFSYTITDGTATATAQVTVKVTGLLAGYALNERTGLTLGDVTGQYPLTANGGTWVDGVNDGAFQLNGTDQSATSANSVNLGTEFTISAWIKSDNLSGDRAILSQTNVFAFKTYGTGLRFTTPAVKDHQVSDIGLQTGVWTHLAVTFSEGQTGGCKFYKDGTLVATIDASQINEADQPLKFGDSQWSNQDFGGAIDELHIYNKVLTAAEIATLAVDPNTAPVAVADSATVNEDTTVSITVLSNDTDLENDTLSISAVTQGTYGTATINGTSVDYTPNANYNGADSFTYTITDGTDTATATVNVTVTAVNDAPVATVDTATTEEDTAVTISVLSNDSDIENDTLTVQSVTVPTNGTAVINGNQVVYTPAANYNGADAFTYTISDGTDTATATVNVTVTAVNDAPIATVDSATTDEDTAVTISVLNNDSDVENDTLTVQSVTTPTNGTAVINGNQVVYTPVANYNGADAFTYTVTDGTDTATATVNVTVNAVNDAPVAVNDTVTTQEDQAVTITVLANDSDVDGQTLTIESVSTPVVGSAVISGDQVIYTPNANVNAVDAFTYTITDGTLTATATVTVTIEAVNDAPTAGDDKAFTVAAQAVTITVLSNDSDADGDSITIDSFTQGTQGSVDQVGNDLVYTPLGDFTVSDSFTYTISDGNGGSTAATVNVYDSNITVDFESVQGFAEQSGTNALVTTEDIFGTTWYSADGAYLWNRSDIPPSGVQCLTLEGDQSCQFQISEVYNGVQSLTFDYASFSSATSSTFTVWYDRLDGNGWQQAWSTSVSGMVPDWRSKPWPQINIDLNLDGPVILLFQTAGRKGVLVDTVTVTPQP